MSNEVAQPVEHESSRSSKVEVKSGTSPVLSNPSFQSGDDTRLEKPRDVEPTLLASTEDEPSATTSETLNKKQALLHVPSRSSSRRVNPSPTSTGLSGATASDPTGSSIGGRSRESNSSITAKKRNGSVISSKVSGPSPAYHESTSGEVNDTTSSPAPMQKSKKSRGFLSFLNCCGVPDNANGVEAEEKSHPAKQVATVPTQGKATTVNKPTSSTSNSNSAQPSKEREETVTMVEDQTSSQSAASAPVDGPVSEKSSAAPDRHIHADKNQDQPLPAIPTDAEKDTSELEVQEASNPSLFVQAPTPVIPQKDVTSIAAASSTENENIPQEQGNDPLPTSAQESDLTSAAMADRSSTALPPPPPMSGSESAGDNSSSPHDLSPQISQEDKHQWLLPPIEPRFKGKKCLVLDLDETLVHSSFKILHQADFTIPVEIEGQYHNVYVIKRPGVDQFMKRVGELYEVVVFTASVSKYGDPLLDQLDIHHVVHHRLFRESCYNHQGNYVKDLSQVGRDLRETIIIDNSPTSYIFHPQHAVPISSWFSDAHDNELIDLIPVLEDLAGTQVRDVSLVLDVAL